MWVKIKEIKLVSELKIKMNGTFNLTKISEKPDNFVFLASLIVMFLATVIGKCIWNDEVLK